MKSSVKLNVISNLSHDFMSQDGHFFVYSLLCESYEYHWDVTVSIAWKNHFMKIVLSHEFTELVTCEEAFLA